MTEFKEGDYVRIADDNGWGVPPGDFIVARVDASHLRVRPLDGSDKELVISKALCTPIEPTTPDRPGAVGPRKLCVGDVVRLRVGRTVTLSEHVGEADRGFHRWRTGPGRRDWAFDDTGGAACNAYDIVEVISRVPSLAPTPVLSPKTAEDAPLPEQYEGCGAPLSRSELPPGHPQAEQPTQDGCTHYRVRIERDQKDPIWLRGRCVECGALVNWWPPNSTHNLGGLAYWKPVLGYLVEAELNEWGADRPKGEEEDTDV